MFGVQEATYRPAAPSTPSARSTAAWAWAATTAPRRASSWPSTTCAIVSSCSTAARSGSVKHPTKVSRGWDGACNRTMTWVELKDRKSGKEFFYFNTHLDHKGKAAREEGVKLLIEKIHEIAGKKAPAIVGGDFNTPVDSPIFKPLTKYMVSARAKAATTDHKGKLSTDSARLPTPSSSTTSTTAAKLKCQLFATLDGNYGAPYISDHYPIAMVFTL